MKKTIKFLVLFIVLAIGLVGCEQKSVNTNDNEHLKDIDYTTFNKMIENKEKFILEVVQTGCANCTDFTPTFESVLEEYDIIAYSLNITDMNEEENETFIEKYKVSGTPTVLFFENGKETSTLKRITGNQEKSKVISKLKVNGYID